MNDQVEAIIVFCDSCLNEKISITLNDERIIVGKLLSADTLQIVLSKEENFYIIGNEDKKYSSKLLIDPKSVKDVRLVLKELERD